MIRILIADDHAIVREGLKRILNENPDMSVIGEAESGDEIIETSKTEDIDVLLLDITMPGPGFLETLRRFRTNRPQTPVLVLSVHPEEQYAVRALRAGAAGYLTKEQSPDELEEAIRRIHGGGRYVSPSLAEKLAFDLQDSRTDTEPAILSDREFEILTKIGAGKSYKEIAYELALSPKTVSTYRVRILGKLNLKSTADLVRYTVEHNLSE